MAAAFCLAPATTTAVVRPSALADDSSQVQPDHNSRHVYLAYTFFGEGKDIITGPLNTAAQRDGHQLKMGLQQQCHMCVGFGRRLRHRGSSAIRRSRITIAINAVRFSFRCRLAAVRPNAELRAHGLVLKRRRSLLVRRWDWR